jgi:hypothetical protein
LYIKNKIVKFDIMKKDIRKSLLGKRDLSTGRVSVGSALGRILLHRKDDSNKIFLLLELLLKMECRKLLF